MSREVISVEIAGRDGCRCRRRINSADHPEWPNKERGVGVLRFQTNRQHQRSSKRWIAQPRTVEYDDCPNQPHTRSSCHLASRSTDWTETLMWSHTILWRRQSVSSSLLLTPNARLYERHNSRSENCLMMDRKRNRMGSSAVWCRFLGRCHLRRRYPMMHWRDTAWYDGCMCLRCKGCLSLRSLREPPAHRIDYMRSLHYL